MHAQNIIFDLDGTLIDSFPGIEQAYQKALRRVLPDRTIPDIKNLIGPPINIIFTKSLQLEDEATLEELVKEFKAAYDASCWKNTLVYPGIASVLQQLHDNAITLFIVTNKRLYPTLKILKYFDLYRFFKEIITPDINNPPFSAKRHSLSFLVNKYQIPVKKTIFVGDSVDDYEAAVANNITFVAADYGYGQVSYNHKVQVGQAIQFPEQLFTVINKN